MFSYKERMMAVELYMQRGCNVGAVLRELGYPSPGALRQWHKECKFRPVSHMCTEI
ncbi:MAG: hypothetical protein SNH27_10765 [Rikenellaceae bacterium]